MRYVCCAVFGAVAGVAVLAVAAPLLVTFTDCSRFVEF